MPNKPVGEGGAEHAYVRDGTIFISSAGHFWKQTPSSAWNEWFSCFTTPGLRPRAEAIRACLTAVGFYQ